MDKRWAKFKLYIYSEEFVEADSKGLSTVIITVVQSVLLSLFNQLTLIATELNVCEETTYKWQNHGLVTNKYAPTL